MQVRILTTALPIPPCNCTNRTMYSFCMQSKHKTCTGNQSKNKNIFYSPLQSEKTNEHVGMFLNGSFDQHALSCITLNLQCSSLWGPSRSSRQKIDKVCSIDLQYRAIKSADSTTIKSAVQPIKSAVQPLKSVVLAIKSAVKHIKSAV